MIVNRERNLFEIFNLFNALYDEDEAILIISANRFSNVISGSTIYEKIFFI